MTAKERIYALRLLEMAENSSEAAKRLHSLGVQIAMSGALAGMLVGTVTAAASIADAENKGRSDA